MELKELFSNKEVKRTKGLYSFYDTKTELYSPPVALENDGDAMRSTMQFLQQPNAETPMHKFPNDYILMKIGEWEERKGALNNIENKPIANCGELVQRKPENNG